MTGQELAAAIKTPTHEGVQRAMTKIADILPKTPLLPLEADGVTLWCKAEMLQPVGAFKIRGAWHRLSDLNEEERARGVVGVSSGNHAQGVAWAAKKLGIAATIVMPSNAPRMKLEATKALGAQVVLYDRATESRDDVAASLITQSGATLVHAFGDPWVIEGQGTAGRSCAGRAARAGAGAGAAATGCWLLL
jgi:threonine dehydratase